MNKNSKIFIAGHGGLVGSAILRKLQAEGHGNLVLRTRDQLDLRNSAAVKAFFETERPAYVFLAAAKVGGIWANSRYPADFIYDNLVIQTNVIHSAYLSGAKKLLFLGSSCIYPRDAAQPIREDYLLTGPLEPTNEAYAVAKIAGIKMCQAYNSQYGANFISAMPTNIYGPNDNFDLENSHVLPALIRKFYEAKESKAGSVAIWGTGAPRREFLHADDLADAVLFLMNNYDQPELVNVGSGQDLTIKELALMIKETVGFEGDVVFDRSKPDGMPRKLLDVSRLSALGWEPKVALKDGVLSTYRWYADGMSAKLTGASDRNS
jgi:GDP-L-fucose synthase